MNLNFFKEILQVVIVFYFGYGLCYYNNVTKTAKKVGEDLPQACVPLYNYCSSLEVKNKVLERSCNNE